MSPARSCPCCDSEEGRRRHGFEAKLHDQQWITEVGLSASAPAVYGNTGQSSRRTLSDLESDAAVTCPRMEHRPRRKELSPDA